MAWYESQKPAGPEYVQQYFNCAAEVGRAFEWSSRGNTIAMAPA